MEMRILMTSRRFPPDVHSGTETVFRALYREARERHEVRLVVGWQSSRDQIPPEAVGVRLRGMSKPKQWFRMAKAIRAEVQRWKPDVVLSNNLELPPTGVPAVCVVHDLNFGENPTDRTQSSGLTDWFRKAGYGAGSRMFESIVTATHASAEAIGALGVDRGRITVIRNGVDAPPPAEASPESDLVTFIYPSRIMPSKGQHLAIDAIARLPGVYKRRATLVIAGASVDGVYLDQLRVQAYNQPVQFSPDVREMLPLIQSSDVVLFPTMMPEGFGQVAVEAMACGKPVIWSDQSAIREATGGIGIPVVAGDVDSLRAAMRQLMDDPDQLRSLGRAGQQYIRSQPDWAGVWAQYERVLVLAAQ